MIIATRRKAATALIAAGTLALSIVPAHADGHVSAPLVGDLSTPLGLAVGNDGTIYVAQSFAGVLTAVDKRGNSRTIAQVSPPDSFIGGVAADGRGTVSYTVSGAPPQGVYRVLPNGGQKLLGNTSDIEFGNPDGNVQYGFVDGLPTGCAVSPLTEPGDVNPNAYAVAILPDGSRVVADAGGNTLIRVRANGSTSVLAVLPPVRLTVTTELAAERGWPACTVGQPYTVHPVPTDVEVGPDGMLYVSSLPGGTEDAAVIESLGSPGGVFRVDPLTGSVTRYASGFVSAVDLAVAPDGTVYVAEMFANRISKVVNGQAVPVAFVPLPGAVEYAMGKLYATILALTDDGAVVTITL